MSGACGLSRLDLLGACKDSARRVRAAADGVCPPYGEEGCDIAMLASPLLAAPLSLLQECCKAGARCR